VEIKATDLGKNTSMLEGQDGNITVAEAWRDAGSSPAATKPLSGKNDTDKGYRTISRAITWSGPVRRFRIS
jgi:hypothetical protein